jgi:hypothetical protein
MSRALFRRIKLALLTGAVAESIIFGFMLVIPLTGVQEHPWLDALDALQEPAGTVIMWAMGRASVRHFSTHFPPMAFVRGAQLILFTIQTLLFALEALIVMVLVDRFRRRATNKPA